MCKDIFLCINILLKILVDVQVVGGQVGDDGDVGAAGHGHQLKAGQLQHRNIVRLHAPGLRQQRMADIAPQMDGLPRPSQELRDDGGGRRLAVAAGDGDLRAGTDLKKYLHLAGQSAAPLHGGGKLGQVGPHTGSAENDVLGQVVQVALPQPQAAAIGLQLLRHDAEGLPVLLIAGGDGDSPVQQQLEQGLIADADADDGHGLILQ